MKARQRWIGLLLCYMLIVLLWTAVRLRPTHASSEPELLRDTSSGPIAFISTRDDNREIPGDVSPASSDTLLIRSFPIGLNAYVVPKDVAEGMLGTVKMTAEEYFVGQTPVEVDLEPGEYRVTVELDESFKFRQDSEVSILYVLAGAGEMAPIAKIYALDKRSDEKAYITALFWPEEMALAEYVTSLPEEQLFPLNDETFFRESFAAYGIPDQDWPFLLAMLSQTGKAVWYSPDSAQRVLLYFTAPGNIVAEPSLPSSPASDEVTPSTAELEAELFSRRKRP
jgi:hypothetical protein